MSRAHCIRRLRITLQQIDLEIKAKKMVRGTALRACEHLLCCGSLSLVMLERLMHLLSIPWLFAAYRMRLAREPPALPCFHGLG
jgi:hypothetical protein